MSEQLQERHALPERVFHWVMALTVVVCLATAFLPIIGLEFAWVDPHWIAGVLLTVAVLFHLWRVFFRLKLSDMWIYLSDLRELRSLLESNDSESERRSRNTIWVKSFTTGLLLCYYFP
jgi:cytochrome b subunit of formate dehydrogenase